MAKGDSLSQTSIENEVQMRRILMIIIVLSTGSLKAQLLTLKTDALWDCAMIPNLNVELVTGNKTSINVSVLGAYKPWKTNIKLLGAIPEFRYWFNGRPMTREFIGIAAITSTYDITWGNEVYQGNAYGGGMTFGYVFYLSRHWNIECYGSVGAVYYNHKHYYTKDFYSENRRTGHGYALIPFKLGISFAYIIK